MRALLIVSILSVVFGLSRVSLACGSLVFREEHGAMADQQVLIAQGKERTVLMVSVGYANVDDEFAFLLPLQHEPLEVVEGEPKLFKSLDEMTAPWIQVVDATSTPATSRGCCGAPVDAGSGGHAEDQVFVAQHGETTSYEYVVLGGSSGSTVSAWLQERGFAAPSALSADIDDYLSKKWLFLAAKLKPSTARGALAPLEIHYARIPVAELEYPFRFSRHSLKPSSRVAIDLYLAGDAMLPANYAVRRVNRGELRALSPRTTNYEALADGALAGKAFLLQSGSAEESAARVFGQAWLDTPHREPPALTRTYEKLLPERIALVRLHAELSGSDLDDLHLMRATPEQIVFDRTLRVRWGSPTSTASMVGLLFGLVALRRRSRAR
ncbi:MAG: DUF2330 domain-containing protein [Polyangiaceae bacterium]